MSFQAYLDNIEAKTGKSPADFRKLAIQKGYTEKGRLRADVKAGQIVAWLKVDFALGHGHAMAIYALLKGLKSEERKMKAPDRPASRPQNPGSVRPEPVSGKIDVRARRATVTRFP